MTESFLSAFDWSRRNSHMDGFPLMDSFWPIFGICSFYVFLVKFAGPAFMANREPFNVRRLMAVHNATQVAISSLQLVGLYYFGWFGEYNWICQEVTRFTTTSNLYKVHLLTYYGVLLRFVDFADTFFFLAQKKFAHVSNLQVFHHFTVPLMGWMYLRYVPHGNYSFGMLLNTIVHVVMYSYYFLAALGPDYVKYLWWKKYLTTLQIGQFVVVLVKELPVTLGWIDCPLGQAWQFTALQYIYGIILLLMFTNYYVQAYVKVSETRKGK